MISINTIALLATAIVPAIAGPVSINYDTLDFYFN